MMRLRRSALTLFLAAAAWTAGCATPQPMMEPFFAARSYTPLRIALLPPDVFVVLDQVGANDPVASAALGQAVSAQTVQSINQLLRSRGYDVDLTASWNGISAQDGSLLVTRDDLGWFANSVLQFANSPDGGGRGPMQVPRFVAPELAARVGWATQSDALLYVNIKGVSVTAGKRTAEVVAAVFIVVIVAALIALLVASGRGDSHGGGPGLGGSATRGQPVLRGSPPLGGAGRAPVGLRGSPPAAGMAPVAPRGRGVLPPPRGAVPGRVYGGGPRVGIGVDVVVPLDGPVYTHDGTVTHEDDTFAGDQLYVTMTLVSAHDGRVLWHMRRDIDLDAQDPRDVDLLARAFIETIPPRAGFEAAPAPR
jgi:hypothetical protein